jgi:hypothetical protein
MYVCCCCCCCVCLDHHTTAHKERHKRRVRVLLYSAVDGSTRRTGPLLIARGGGERAWAGPSGTLLRPSFVRPSRQHVRGSVEREAASSPAPFRNRNRKHLRGRGAPDVDMQTRQTEREREPYPWRVWLGGRDWLTVPSVRHRREGERGLVVLAGAGAGQVDDLRTVRERECLPHA